jgi:hypothetical protein
MPRAIHQRVLHALTGRDTVGLGFTPHRTTAAPTPEAGEPQQDTDMNRRHLLLAAGAAVLLPVLDAERHATGSLRGLPHREGWSRW